ncbi:hypothetical protein ETAA8_39120 [Anatilimnocola aggregata]|uniref:Uncharacterized protein n=1 Tax=Anatilimnocola aggregata TaxID=2528021 RepID=A0A517YEZ7_9BACT|nr:hypothetical protein ETAA8_39120 [Anatilimnocola aggregata]
MYAVDKLMFDLPAGITHDRFADKVREMHILCRDLRWKRRFEVRMAFAVAELNLGQLAQPFDRDPKAYGLRSMIVRRGTAESNSFAGEFWPRLSSRWGMLPTRSEAGPLGSAPKLG